MTVYEGFVIVADRSGHSHAGVLSFGPDVVTVPRVAHDVLLLDGHKGVCVGRTVSVAAVDGGVWVEIDVAPDFVGDATRIGVSPELTGVKVHKDRVTAGRLARIAVVPDPAWDTFLNRVDTLLLDTETETETDTDKGDEQ